MRVDRAAAEDWIRAHVEPVGAIETAHERPWATVLRVPLADKVAWFKACAPVQAFEPRLAAGLFTRWPDRVAEVLGHDEEQAWLLLADAGTPLRESGNPPESWLVALPLYAELQRGEAAHMHDHVAHGVPDLRVATFLEEVTKLPPGDPWFARLRDAYLEPWGRGLDSVFALAMRVGTFAHAIAWLRQRDHLPEKERGEFDRWYPIVLRRAVAETLE
jgi:hypothetical protein